jgi:hypothetical protein
MQQNNAKREWKCALPILMPRPEGFKLVLTENWLNAEQASAKLNISLRKFKYWKKNEVFPWRNEGGTFSYNEAELDDLIRRMYHSISKKAGAK